MGDFHDGVSRDDVAVIRAGAQVSRSTALLPPPRLTPIVSQ